MENIMVSVDIEHVYDEYDEYENSTAFLKFYDISESGKGRYLSECGLGHNRDVPQFFSSLSDNQLAVKDKNDVLLYEFRKEDVLEVPRRATSSRILDPGLVIKNVTQLTTRNGILLTFELPVYYSNSGDIVMRKITDLTTKNKVAEKIHDGLGSFARYQSDVSGFGRTMKRILMNFTTNSKFVCTTWKETPIFKKDSKFTPIKASLWDMNKPNVKIIEFSVAKNCCPTDVKYSERDTLLVYSINESGAKNEILGFDLRQKPQDPSLKISNKPRKIDPNIYREEKIEYITKMFPLLSRKMLICGTSEGYLVSYDLRTPNCPIWTHDVARNCYSTTSYWTPTTNFNMVLSADEKYVFCKGQKGDHVCRLDGGTRKPKRVWKDTFRDIGGNGLLCVLGEDSQKREIRLNLYEKENEDGLFGERMEFLKELWERKEEERNNLCIVVEKKVILKVPWCLGISGSTEFVGT